MPQRAILGNNRVHRSRDAGDHPDRADYNACNGAEEWEPSSHLGLDSAAHYIRKPKAGPPAGVACIFFNERGGLYFFLDFYGYRSMNWRKNPKNMKVLRFFSKTNTHLYTSSNNCISSSFVSIAG